MKWSMILGLLSALLFTGCGCEEVPPGFVGLERSGGTFDQHVLQPGKYTCGVGCRMFLMEISDHDYEVKVSVLCADSLPFDFRLNILAAVNTESDLAAVLKGITGTNGVLHAKAIFDTYIASVVQETARKVVSKYATSALVGMQAGVMEEIRLAVIEATKGSVMRIKRVTISDLSFPEVITRAQELKAQRHVEIETARAEGEKAAAQAEAQLKLAEIQAKRRLLEAQATADANNIIANSITPGFLAYEQIKAMSIAAEGQNNVFFYPYQDAQNKVLSLDKLVQSAVISSDLKGRVTAAKEAALTPSPAPSAESPPPAPQPPPGTP